MAAKKTLGERLKSAAKRARQSLAASAETISRANPPEMLGNPTDDAITEAQHETLLKMFVNFSTGLLEAIYEASLDVIVDRGGAVVTAPSQWPTDTEDELQLTLLWQDAASQMSSETLAKVSQIIRAEVVRRTHPHSRDMEN